MATFGEEKLANLFRLEREVDQMHISKWIATKSLLWCIWFKSLDPLLYSVELVSLHLLLILVKVLLLLAPHHLLLKRSSLPRFVHHILLLRILSIETPIVVSTSEILMATSPLPSTEGLLAIVVSLVASLLIVVIIIIVVLMLLLLLWTHIPGAVPIIPSLCFLNEF